MGKWTPLVLMAGGLAILLGTLLGISFPMDGRNAQAPESSDKASSVLPANINVNSTTAKQSPGNANDGNTVAQSPQDAKPSDEIKVSQGETQNQDNAQTVVQDGTAQGTGGDGTGGDGTGGEGTDAGNNNEPIRALW